MTDLKERLEESMKLIRDQKEETVSRTPDDPDMLSSIVVYRGGEKVAIMGCLPDRDVQLWLLKLAICAMDADEVVFSMETYHTLHPVNPGTGEVWKNGDLQKAMEEKPDWYVSGMVQEAVATFCWNRAGEMEAGTQSFEIHGNKVEWVPSGLTTHSKMEAGRTDGFIHDEVSMMWLEESTFEWTKKEAKRLGKEHLYEGKSEVKLRTDADIAIAKYIIMRSNTSFCGLMSSEDPEDERTKLLMASKGWHPDLSKLPEQ